MNRLTSFAALVFAALAAPLSAQEAIQFARSPDISPDGATVCFSYLGDLWLVDAKGGVARHLTMHEKHDYNPVFSPDGTQIAFSSNRHGSYDVFVVSTRGGRPTRLTFDSADDHVTGWSPDGQRVLFMSGRHVDYPPRIEMYSVAAKGGQARQVSSYEGREGVFSPTGDLIAYVRGPGTWYRNGYKGSSNDDIWVMNADGTNNRQVTSHHGQDNFPMWSPDGKTLYYVSDCLGGLANVVRQEIEPTTGLPVAGKSPERVTDHKDERVRRMRLGGNGEWLVYECGADIWVRPTKDGATSRKLKIEVFADDKTNPETITTFTNKATEFALSPDEKHIAFVVHGEIFLMPRAGGKARRLTDSPAFDHGVAWSPDSKRLFFLSDRSGFEDIYVLEPDDPDHPELVQAHRFKVRQVTNTPEAEGGISFSPDGTKVGFLRAGKLMVMNPDGTGERVLASNGSIFDYEWSPDSKWICYARTDGSFASELFIIPATGATPQDPARNVTRFATYNGGITWSKTGNKIAFISNRQQNTPSAYVLSLRKPASAGAAPGKPIDWDDIHLRVKHPATQAASECAISADGSRIAYRAVQDKQDDLWVASVDGGQVLRVTTGNLRPRQITWSRLFPSQLYFRDGDGNLRSVFVGGPLGSGPSTIPFQARLVVKQDELFLEIFDQAWRHLNESFYDASFHGANWRAAREKYRALVKHCGMKEDLYTLISLMLGELNASHLGISGSVGVPDQQTADLGIVFDRTFAGPGPRVREVVRNGPADKHGVNLKPGDVLLAIDGNKIEESVDTAKLLNDKAGETLTLTVTSNPADAKAKRRVEVQAVARTAMTPLMYERWIKRNANRVAELSQGKLGYIHIPSMDEPGLERFVRALYSDNFDKEGIVLDVRFNGGGFTHEKVLNYLVGREHTFFANRNGGSGQVLNAFDRKWTRPLALLINNRSYSDAEIFPNAFRTYGLGKLVGQATGGHVIGTRNIQLIDGSVFRTPRIGVHTVKGVNMEREGVRPDVEVAVHPDQLARGEDAQLERAVRVLTEDVTAWKKARPPIASGPTPTGTTPTVSPAPPGHSPMLPPKE